MRPMRILRTPPERFEGLPDYPYRSHIHQVPAGDGSGLLLRLSFVDEGAADAPPLVLLHGEPSWSFLYRVMIDPLVAGGFRVFAPDLIGFGRSDKPAALEDYTYQRHVDWLETWLLDLDLRRITLFAQDWGGLIGLRLVAAHPDRFDRVVVANTFLPTGEQDPGEAFLRWRDYVAGTPVLPIGKIVQRSTVTELPDDVLAGYEAPFPDPTYMAGPRAFPALVPTERHDPGAAENRAAWTALREFAKPFLTAFSDSDPITRGAEAPFQTLIPGARGRHHRTITGAGHFLQEDKGEELADLLLELAATT